MQPTCMNCGRCMQEVIHMTKNSPLMLTMTCLQDGLQKGAGDKACSFWLGKEKYGHRPVHYGQRKKEGSTWKSIYRGVGWFHQWVSESQDGENGTIIETYALIELEDGTMTYAYPFLTQFADTGAARTICVQEEVVPPQTNCAQGSEVAGNA